MKEMPTLSRLDSDEERLHKAAILVAEHGRDLHLWTAKVAGWLQDAAGALEAARMPDAERRAIVEHIRSFKGGQKECDACGCWNLVDAIADSIEHADYRLGERVKPKRA